MKSNLNTSSFRSLLKAFCSALFFLTVALMGSEQVTEVGSLGILRKDHTATVLSDGRVLILGGQNVAGELASAEIYDPATRTFVSAGSMSAARIGHATTLLPDGKVLITGGRNESGPLATAEIFDSAAAVPFRTLTGSMGSARQRHTSTLLSTGKVLLAGGDLSGTAEIYDPATETFSSPLIAMIEPRAGQTATTLPENSVLLAGGGSRSVELFDVQTSEFLSWSAVLSEIRTGQSAITAPDSSLYFIGGEPYGTLEKFDLMSTTAGVSLSLGAPVSSATLLANGKVLVTGPVLASLFNPTTNALSPVANGGLLQRSGQTVTELPAGKQILVVGGVDANTAYVAPATIYNPAHIVTDKQDYYPDEPVIVYGSGWKPGEGVDLYVVDDLGWLYDSTVTADADGLFTADPYFVVLMQHLGVTFDLTAIGAQSGLQAKHTFTDGQVKFQTSGLPSGISVSVNWSYDTPTATTGTATFSSPGPFNAFSVNNRNATYTFPATIISSGITYQYVSGSATNPFNTGPGGATTTTVTGTYKAIATKLVVTSVSSATYGSTFSVTVEAQDGGGTPRNVTASTAVTLSLSTGTGSLGGTVTGTMIAGTNSVTITGATYSKAETGVQLTATRTSGDTLSAGVSASFNVSPRAITVTADAKNKSYGDVDPTLTSQVTSGSLVSGDSVTGALTRDSGENVGTYAITQGTLTAGSNYDLTYVGANLTIDARAVTITADAKSKTYGDVDPALTYHITIGTLAFSDAFSGALARGAGESVGSYAITQGTLALSANYALSFAGANLDITARAVSVAADAKSKTYGDVDPALTYHITIGTLAFSDAFSGALARGAGESVGSYAITQGTLTLSANYALSFAGADLDITARAASVTPDAATKTYGNAEPALTGTLSGFLAGDYVTATYSRVAGENVASSPYPISALLSPAGVLGNYAITYNTAAFTITPATLTVTADHQTKVYGHSDPSLTFGSSGFQFTDTVASVLSGALSRAAGESVGGYAIGQGTLIANANYQIAFTGESFEITVRSISIAADAKTKVYGDADPALTFHFTNGTSLAFSDVFAGNLSRATGESVGTYAIEQGSLALSSNYALTFSGSSLEITVRAITVKADDKAKTYGDADPAFTQTITVGTLAFSDAFNGTLSRVAGQNVGHYAIQQGTLSLNSNYALTFVSGDLAIGPKTASVTAAAAGKTYGDADPVLTGVLSGFLGADNVTATYSRTSGEAVGGSPYTISATLSPAAVLGNYTITPTDAAFTITKKSASVTPDAANKIFAAADPTFTGTLNGFLPADNVTATYTRTTGETVAGSPYAISATLSPAAVLGNYQITYNTAEFTIKAWTWTGFFQPVDNYPVVNRCKAGSAIPVKFSLGGNKGLSIFATGYAGPGSVQIATPSSAFVSDIVAPTDTAGGSVLSYDAASGQYIYVWKTEKNWGGTSRQLILRFADGSVQFANFTFTK